MQANVLYEYLQSGKGKRLILVTFPKFAELYVNSSFVF